VLPDTFLGVEARKNATETQICFESPSTKTVEFEVVIKRILLLIFA